MAENSGHRSEKDARITKLQPPDPGHSWREISYDFRSDKQQKEKHIPEKNYDDTDNFVFGFPQTNNNNISVTTTPPPTSPPPEYPASPSMLISQRSSGEFSLEMMDLEMNDFQDDFPVEYNETSTVRRRRTSHDSAGGDKLEQILKCSSKKDATFSNSSSFKKKSKNLFRQKTKSRLSDVLVPAEPSGKSGRLVTKSGQAKAGFLARVDEEDDDPFGHEDVPEEYRKDKLDIWVLLEWVSLILIVSALVSTFVFRSLRHKNVWKLRLWKWQVLVLVLVCGRLVSRWVIKIIVFFIEKNFLLRKRVLYFVYGVKNPVRNCLWLSLVLMAWHFLFDKKVQRVTKSEIPQYVTKVLICWVVGTLLWLVKTLLVKVLASSFSVNNYFDRIQESLFNQYVIETLSGPPVPELKRNEQEEVRIAAEIQKMQNACALLVPHSLKAATSTSLLQQVLGGSFTMNKGSRIVTPKSYGRITIDHLHKLNPKNVSAWNMKRLMDKVRYGALSTLNEEIRDNSSTHDESATKIRSEIEAKAAAKKIFYNVARPGSRFIYLEDLTRFLEEDEALKAMDRFEGVSESDKLSKSCLKNWVVHAFRERRALALTLIDTKTAVKKLHNIVNVIVGGVVCVVWLLILGIATTKFLVFISSQLVLVAFVFGNTCKTIFESIIFLFVIHPFDVGDRCDIDGREMVVEEMNILTTVFLSDSNQKIIIPNSVLAMKAISNYYRSPDMGDGIDFFIHIATPPEKIALMRERITSYIENKKEHWYPSPMIIYMALEGLNQVRMSVWFCHTINHQDMGEKFSRKALLLEEMVKIFRDLDMQYRMLPLDINVRALPQVSSDRVPPSWKLTE